MGVGAGLYMCDVVKKFTFAVSSPDEFLLIIPPTVRPTMELDAAWVESQCAIIMFGVRTLLLRKYEG